jgi:hypothetical protein
MKKETARLELYLYREAGMRLFQPMHENFDPNSGQRRKCPSGEMLCDLCSSPYRNHPPFEEEGVHRDDGADVRLCTGEVVHL